MNLWKRHNLLVCVVDGTKTSALSMYVLSDTDRERQRRWCVAIAIAQVVAGTVCVSKEAFCVTVASHNDWVTVSIQFRLSHCP